MKESLIQLNLSAAFDRASHRGLLCKLRSIDVEGQLILVHGPENLSDRRHRVRWMVRSLRQLR